MLDLSAIFASLWPPCFVECSEPLDPRVPAFLAMTVSKYVVDVVNQMPFTGPEPLVVSCGEGLVGTAPKDRVDPQRQPCGDVD